MRAVLLVCLGWVAAAGCGDEGKSCESVYQRVCPLACACTEGPECSVKIALPNGGGGVTPYQDPEDCARSWPGDRCESAYADAVDYDGCDAALDTARCVEDSGEMVLLYPSECIPEGP